MDLTWTSIPDANLYRIDYESADGTDSGTITSTQPLATIENLQPGTTYTVSVVGFTPTGAVDVGTVDDATGLLKNLTLFTCK